jgi:hypothetical protein
MSGKMKVLLGVLSLGAVASLVYVWSMFRSPGHVTTLADPAVLQAQSLGILERPRDTDGDGLDDTEETYWEADFNNKDTDGDGFLDGEEVLSGHNPAIAGPNDWLDRSKNLTRRMTELMVGGIMAGDLKPGTPHYDASVEHLTEDIMERYKENRTITVDDIILTSADGPAERSAYVLHMAWILKGVFAPVLDDASKFLESVGDITWVDPAPLTNDPKRFVAFSTAARTLAQATGQRAIKVAAVPVPRVFTTQHKDAIRLLRILQRNYELVATIKDDQLQGMAALQSIINLHTDSMPKFMVMFADSVTRNFSTDAQ